jgi:hypothetical protein
VGKGQSITIAEEEEQVITRRTAARQYCGDRLRRVTRHVTSTIARSSDMACRATPPVVTVTRCQLLGATGNAAADRRVMLTVHAVDRSYNRLSATGGCGIYTAHISPASAGVAADVAASNIGGGVARGRQAERQAFAAAAAAAVMLVTLLVPVAANRRATRGTAC